MSRRTWWITGFLTVTGVAVGAEVFAAVDSNPDFPPWTDLLVTYVPEPVVMGGAALLAAWIVPHFAGHYPKEIAMTQFPPTQTRHPWRATVRTIVAGGIALATLAPTIALTAHVDTVPAVVQVLAVAGAVTRIMAIPAVNDALTKLGLGATPPKA